VGGYIDTEKNKKDSNVWLTGGVFPFFGCCHRLQLSLELDKVDLPPHFFYDTHKGNNKKKNKPKKLFFFFFSLQVRFLKSDNRRRI
jgi:hypothetical protein